MRKQRIGCIGWGYHFDDECGKTVAVCDINPAKGEQWVLKHPETAAYTDYRRMISEQNLDLVVISTPNESHRVMAEHCLRHGLHVFLEKPMGVNREELDSLLLTQQQSGRHLAIDFELRVSYIGRRIKEIINSGEIGEPVGVEFIHHRGAWLARGNNVWRTDPSRSGGLYFMEVCHEIDLFRHWFGDIEAVQSFSFPNVLPQYRDGMPDNICTHLWFRNGVRGLILTSHTSSVHDAKPERYDELGHDMFFVITGSRGSIRLDCIRHRILVCHYRDFHPDADRGLRVELERVEDHSGMSASEFHHDCRGNLESFIRNMAEEIPPHQDAADARLTHLSGLAAEESAKNGSQKIFLEPDCTATIPLHTYKN